MKNIQRFIIFLLWLVATVAVAQTLNTPIRLVDNRGCEIYVPSSANVKEMTIANAMGECRSGKFEGGVLVGISWELVVPGQEAKTFIGMRAGVVSQGRYTGLRVSINQEATLFLNGPNNEPELTRRFKQSEPGYSIEQVVSAIEVLLPKAGGNTSDGARSFLVNLVRTWDRAPFDMMHSYTANWGQTTQNMAWVGLSPEQRQAYAASQANTTNQSNQSSQSNSGITTSKIETAAEILNGVNNLLRASRGQAPVSIGSTSSGGVGNAGSSGSSCSAELENAIQTEENCRKNNYCGAAYSSAMRQSWTTNHVQRLRASESNADQTTPQDAQRSLDAAVQALENNNRELQKLMSSRLSNDAERYSARSSVARAELSVCERRYALRFARGKDSSNVGVSR